MKNLLARLLVRFLKLKAVEISDVSGFEPDTIVLNWVVSDSEGNRFVIMGKRSPSSLISPLKFAPTGGGIDAGETSQIAAARELYEELGYEISPEDLVEAGGIILRPTLGPFTIDKGCQLFLLLTTVSDVDQLLELLNQNRQEEEVIQVVAVSIEEFETSWMGVKPTVLAFPEAMSVIWDKVIPFLS